MSSISEINPKFLNAFEKAISANSKKFGIKADQESFFKGFLSTMEFAAINLKSGESQLLLKEQSSMNLGKLFCDFSLSLDFEDKNENVLSPRAFGALYEHYCNRSDLAAYYSSADVSKYITEITIGSWLVERLSEKKGIKKYPGLSKPENESNKECLAVISNFTQNANRKELLFLKSLLDEITVLDPTCGCGAFYFAALDFLLDLNLRVAEKLKCKDLSSIEKEKLFDKLISHNLYGVDIDGNAIEVIEFQIKLYRSAFTKKDPNFDKKNSSNLHVGDALIGPPFVGEKTGINGKNAFDWNKKFPQIVGKRGFDIITGNPPYLEFEEAKTADYSKTGMFTSACRDLYALTMERSLQLIASKGRIGFIVPISAYSSPRFDSLRKILSKNLDKIWVASFANRPAQLFKGAQKRLNIIMGRKGDGLPQYYTTEYIRWKSEERPYLFEERMNFVENPLISENAETFYKSGCEEDLQILQKISKFQGNEPWAIHTKPKKHSAGLEPKKQIYFTRAFGYFLYFLNFIVDYKTVKTGASVLPSEFHCLEPKDPKNANAAIAILNSSLFYWFLSQTTDCRNVNFKEVLDFPINFSKFDDLTIKRLSNAGEKLIKKLKASSFYTQKSGIKIQSFDYLSCIDEIKECDSAVLRAYGITGKAALRIESYDAKYRFSVDGKRRGGAAA